MTPRRVAAGVAAAATLLLAFYVFVPREYYTGSNAIRTRGTLIELNEAARKLCLPGLHIPDGTGQVELELDTDTLPRGAMVFTLDGRVTDRLPGGEGGRQKVRFDIPETDGEREAEACVELLEHKVFFGGVPGIPPGERAPEVDGNPVENRAAIWYRPPAGEQASVISRLPTLFERMALFRAGWVGPWTYWVLFLVVAPLLAFAGIRLIVAPERRRLPLLVGALAFAFAGTWGLVTPVFNSPDESEHFAYLQSLAERGKPLESAQTGRPIYSSQESLLLTMTRVLDAAETPDGKPVWRAEDERLYRELAAGEGRASDDGGGYAAAGSSHTPIFYSLGLPFYFAAGDSLLNKAWAVRLVSALLGGLIAACAVLLVLELAPGRRGLAAAAGVAVAFQPMFAFMSGSYNNDMGVNAVSAVICVLLVRLLRRGFSWPVAIGLGVAVALAPLFKLTGYAMFPPAVLALALFAWRYRAHWRRALTAVGVVVAALVVVTLGWGEISAALDRQTFTTPGGTAPGEGMPALQQKGGAIAYVWQIFLPQTPYMNEHWTQSWPAFDIYGLRGWGAFGWYAVTWTHLVYWVIMVTLVALTLVGLVAVARRGTWVRENVPELLVLVAVVGSVIGVMTLAYYSPTPQGDLYPIQGRYVFPALIALAAMFVGATHVVGRWLTVALSTAVVCLGYASLWLVLTEFYFAA